MSTPEGTRVEYRDWDTDPWCLNGWGPTVKHPSCNYTGGHYCVKDYLHTGRCRCECGSTSATKPPVLDGVEAL